MWLGGAEVCAAGRAGAGIGRPGGVPADTGRGACGGAGVPLRCSAKASSAAKIASMAALLRRRTRGRIVVRGRGDTAGDRASHIGIGLDILHAVVIHHA